MIPMQEVLFVVAYSIPSPNIVLSNNFFLVTYFLLASILEAQLH